MRAMVADAVFFCTMVGLGETYVPAFALAVGLGEVVAGLVATVPLLAGALLQLVSPLGVRRVGSYRRWVVGCARLQALCFAPLALGALVGRFPVAALMLCCSAYWGFGMAAGPAWNAWVPRLVPLALRARFFARRSRTAQVALLVAIIGAGLALDRGRAHDSELRVFALLFAAACAARWVSAAFLDRQSEIPGQSQREQPLRWPVVARGLRRGAAGRLLAYLLAMNFTVHLAGPFFTPYMLGPLAFSYAEFMALTAATFVSRILVLPGLGRWAERHGAGRLLAYGALGIVPLPALWLVSQDFAYLFALQLVAGVAWAAVELATLLAFFERIEEAERTAILSLFNLASSLALVAGAALAAQLFVVLGQSVDAYEALFVLSTLGRAAAVALLWGATRLPLASGAAPELHPPELQGVSSAPR